MIALSNLNPQNHLGIVLCNLTRIERGETWGQNSNTTPAVGRFLEALDRERVEIAGAFGKQVGTVLDYLASSFGTKGGSIAEFSASRVAQGSDVLGPKDINTRYVLEDVPFGLIPTLLLADMAGVPARLHRAGIDILSACYGRDFAADNDLLPELGRLDAATLRQLAIDGYEVQSPR